MAWHIVQTHSNQEQRLRDYLDSKNIIAFAPPTKRITKRRVIVEPFLPRYVLTCINLDDGDQRYILRHAYGLRSIVEFAGKPAIVPIQDILLIQSRMINGYVVLDTDLTGVDDCTFRQDELVRATDGLYVGVPALFKKHLKGEDRARILLQSAGFFSNTIVELPMNRIERILPEEII